MESIAEKLNRVGSELNDISQMLKNANEKPDSSYPVNDGIRLLYMSGKLWLATKDAAQYFDCSSGMIREAIKEMKKGDRYRGCVIEDGHFVRVMIFAITDYMYHKQKLRAGELVPPFNPSMWRKSLAMSLREDTEGR